MKNDTLKDFLEIKAKKSINTAEAYRISIQQFVLFVGKDYVECGKQDFVAYANALCGRYKPASVRAKLAAIHNFYEYLAFLDMIPCVPFDLEQFRVAGILPSVEIEKHPFAAVDEKHNINEVKAIVDETETLRDRAIVMVMVETGMRVSEMCDLSNESYNVGKGTLHIAKAKRNEIRDVALDDSAVAALNEYITKERVNGQYLFTDAYGRRLNRRTVSMRIARYSERAVGKHITAHGLRHTCATYLGNQHVDLDVIRQQLGHKSLATTARYMQDVESIRMETTKGAMGKLW